MSDSMNPVDVRRVIAILFRRWRLGLAIVIATLAGVAVTTYLSYPQYEATLKVLIERAPGAEIPYLREQVAFKKAEITQTQCELMRSTPILEEVVRRLNLAERPVPSKSVRDRIHAWLRDLQGWVRDQLRTAKGWLWKVLFKAELAPREPSDPFREALQNLSRRISVEPLPNTDIIVATVRDIDPVLATQIINTLGEIYLESDLSRQRNRAREIYGLIDSQVTAFKPSYEAAAKAVEDFEHEHDARLFEDRIRTKIQEISALEIALSEFQQRQEAKIESLTLELTALRQTYDDDHPQVRAKRSELDQARQMLSGQSSDQTTNKTAAMLVQRIASANEELERLSEREGQYSRLLSRLEQEEELFFQLKREREEALIAEATRAAGTQVFEPAITPAKPTTPKWTINMLFGLFGGFFLAVAVGALLEFLNTAVRDPDDIKSAKARVLGSIPRFGLLTGGQSRGVVSNFSSRSAYVRAQIQIYERIVAEASKPALVVSSPARRDGCSTLAANLACCATQVAQRRTLLVDLNFAHPRIERQLAHVKRHAGLREVLDGKSAWKEAVQCTAGKPDVLTTGLIRQPILAAVVSERLPALLTEWREQYEQIIFDAPPILQSALAGVVNRDHGHLVLLVTAGRTRRAVVEAAIDQCIALRTDLLGIILNKRRFAIPAYAYRRL